MKKIFYSLLTVLLCFVFLGGVKAVEKPRTPVLDKAFDHYELAKYYYELYYDIEEYISNDDPDNPEYSIDGVELYYVDADTCVTNDTCTEVISGGFNVDDQMVVSLPVNTSRRFAARVYVLDEGDNRVYSDYSNLVTVTHTLEAPEIFNPYNTYSNFDADTHVFTYDLGIRGLSYNTSDDPDSPEYTVDGFKFCEKGTDNCVEYEMGAAVVVEMPINQTKTYYAKVFVKDDSDTYTYSSASADLVLSTTVAAPKFSNGYAAYDDPSTDYDKPFTGYENGIYTYDLKIDQTDYELPSDNPNADPVYYVDGYEVCEKGTTTCTTYAVDGAAVIEVEAGQTKTLVARVYVGSGNDRIYSGVSNDVELDTTINAPLFNTEGDSVEYSNGKYVYSKSIKFDDYKYLNRNTSELEYFVDGYEVCEKGADSCIRHDMEEPATISLNPGETKTYFARVYAQDAAGHRTYSAASNDMTIENTSMSIDEIVAEFNKGEMVVALNELGNDIKAELVNNKIVVTSKDENDQTVTILEFVLGGDYIRYSDLDTVITEETAEKSVAADLMVGQMLEAVFIVSGNDNYTLTDGEPFLADDAFEKLGLYLKLEDFEFTSGNEEEGISTLSGSYIRDFKISTNKAVIDTLVRNYGEEVNTDITEAPVVTISKGNNNKLVLTWEEDKHADGYYIYRSESKKGKYKKIATVTEATYTDKKLTYGKTYYYKVKAYNSTSSKTSSIVSKKVKPNKVENLEIKDSGSKKAKLTWDKVSVTGYEVYRSTDQKKWTKVTTLTKSTKNKYTNNYLKSNKKYYYKVRAYKIVSGKKIYGSYSEVVMVKTNPAVPTISVSNSSYNTNKVKVGKVSGASEYRIYRSTKYSGTYEMVGALTEAGSYKDKELTTGKTYYYKVKACNGDGKCGSYSRIVSKKVVPAKPKFTLESSSKKVTVSMTAGDGAHGYKIYRRGEDSTKFTLVKTITNTSYTEKPGTGTFYYKVRAYRTVNKKKVYSSYSSENKVTIK